LRQVVRLPSRPSAEWFVVDLIENAARVGVALSDIEERLSNALISRRFDPLALLSTARTCGTKRTLAVIERARQRAEKLAAANT
jgi:hypothetical protein